MLWWLCGRRLLLVLPCGCRLLLQLLPQCWLRRLLLQTLAVLLPCRLLLWPAVEEAMLTLVVGLLAALSAGEVLGRHVPGAMRVAVWSSLPVQPSLLFRVKLRTQLGQAGGGGGERECRGKQGGVEPNTHKCRHI
jgi:hypothetical protein